METDHSRTDRPTDDPSPRLTDGLSAERLEEVPRDRSSLPADAEFALCLTHDVDRPYKGLRSLYYATRERPAHHLRTLVSSENPYWQFEELASVERDLGVRSAFYLLNEQHILFDRPVRDWFSPANWVQHLGRYDPAAPPMADILRELDAGGWEVGLHGSYHSPTDRGRLRTEKSTLEAVIGHPIVGGRQHYLRLEIPETWKHHRAIGLRYDASLGSADSYGFEYGYRPLRPFGDDFLVFPLTIMEQSLPDPGTVFEDAQNACERVLCEAAQHDAVVTVLWHPRYFNEREFPGYRELYRWLIERARELGAWIGSPEAYRNSIERDRQPDSTRSEQPHDRSSSIEAPSARFDDNHQ